MSTLTAVPGVHVGHWTHSSNTTGATAIVFPGGARVGCSVPGSASGSRELGALDPSHLAGTVHGICLAGGSAFGLAAADGMAQELARRGVGFDTGHGRVPIVPGAILFDLAVAEARPDAASGAHAARNATSDPVAEGRVGAAAGATVARLAGGPLPGGLGSCAVSVAPWWVGALVAVNAAGAVRDPTTAEWIAGCPTPSPIPQLPADWNGGHTTLAVVATDAPLSRPQAVVLARMASAGLARTLYPAFTPFDGDIVFAASTGANTATTAGDLTRLGTIAAETLARAIVRAVTR